jgi:hypothetical protein
VKDLIKEKRCSKQKRAKRSKERSEKIFQKADGSPETDFKDWRQRVGKEGAKRGEWWSSRGLR